MKIPPLLARNVAGSWGDAGRDWLDGLPALLADVCDRWRLTPGDPFELTYHWVMAVARESGEPAVLKLGVPSSDHLRVEAAALRAWNGNGAVRLLEHDPGRGALLVERAEPGVRVAALVTENDTAATDVLIDVMRGLHTTPPPAAGVPDLRELAKDFATYLQRFPDGGPLPERLVRAAARLFDELCDSAPARVLLHGDLHHDNVLSADRRPDQENAPHQQNAPHQENAPRHGGARREWLAIDPHGWVGDPGYDLGCMLYNPAPADVEPDVLTLLPARLDRLTAGAGQPRERVVAWGFVVAVLSEVWTCEDGGDPDGKPLAVAHALEPLL